MKNFFHFFRWKRSWLIGLLAAFITVWFLFFDTHSLMTKLKLDQQKKELIERTEEYKKRTAELENKIEELESSSELIEIIAREDYGMKKPDETVYKVQRNK